MWSRASGGASTWAASCSRSILPGMRASTPSRARSRTSSLAPPNSAWKAPPLGPWSQGGAFRTCQSRYMGSSLASVDASASHVREPRHLRRPGRRREPEGLLGLGEQPDHRLEALHRHHLRALSAIADNVHCLALTQTRALAPGQREASREGRGQLVPEDDVDGVPIGGHMDQKRLTEAPAKDPPP